MVSAMESYKVALYKRQMMEAKRARIIKWLRKQQSDRGVSVAQAEFGNVEDPKYGDMGIGGGL